MEGRRRDRLGGNDYISLISQSTPILQLQKRPDPSCLLLSGLECVTPDPKPLGGFLFKMSDHVVLHRGCGNCMGTKLKWKVIAV
jgi:hypothetical protein